MKRQLLLLGSTVIVIILIIVACVLINNTPQENNNESLWTLVDRMDWLRDLKEECVNNLNIVDSAKFLKGYTWYCDSWDTEIKELRDRINEMSKKDYEGLK